jgi:hypothetical protein
MTKPSKVKMYDKGDDSQAERLNKIYNAMKHVESRIENGQIPDGATVPVWLDNEGLRSTDSHFGFEETFGVLLELVKWADALVDPLTARSAIEKWNK